MNLIDRIDKDLRESMKSRDSLRLVTLRSVKTAAKNKQVELKRELSEDEVIKVISTLAKQRRDSINQFENGGRQDLVENEKKELEILESYLPRHLSEEELAQIVESAVSEAGAQGPRDMGKVMKILMPKVAGRADGKIVSALVNKILQSKN